MANASVDKLKVLAIRHGEKAVVGLAATLFVVFVALAVIHPTMELQPKQLSASADSAQSNLNKPQDRKDILDKLEQGRGRPTPTSTSWSRIRCPTRSRPDDYRVKSRVDHTRAWRWLDPGPAGCGQADRLDRRSPVAAESCSIKP